MRFHRSNILDSFSTIGRKDTAALMRLKLAYPRGFIMDYRLDTLKEKLNISRATASRLRKRLISSGTVRIAATGTMILPSFYRDGDDKKLRHVRIDISADMTDSEMLAALEAYIIKENLRAQGFMADLKSDLIKLNSGEKDLSGRFKSAHQMKRLEKKLLKPDGLREEAHHGTRLSDSSAARLLGVKTSYYRRVIKKRISTGHGLRVRTEFKRHLFTEGCDSYSGFRSHFWFNGVLFSCFTSYSEVSEEVLSTQNTDNQEFDCFYNQKATLFTPKYSRREAFACLFWSTAPNK